VARFRHPAGLAADSRGNLYVADTENHCIRRVAADGTVTTLAGNGAPGFANGAGPQARFLRPAHLALGFGQLYVADTGNHRIRRLSLDGVAATVAGDGVAGYADGPNAAARFHSPSGLAIDAFGHLSVADAGNHRIRRVTLDGMVTTVAGDGVEGDVDGPGPSARFRSPGRVALDHQGRIFVADIGNHRVRSIRLLDGAGLHAGGVRVGAPDDVEGIP
jgi:hypothetical protein